MLIFFSGDRNSCFSKGKIDSEKMLSIISKFNLQTKDRYLGISELSFDWYRTFMILSKQLGRYIVTPPVLLF